MKRNSCWGHEPRTGPVKYRVPDGWTEDGRRKWRSIVTKFAPRQCNADAAETDPACAGCCWINWEEDE